MNISIRTDVYQQKRPAIAGRFNIANSKIELFA